MTYAVETNPHGDGYSSPSAIRFKNRHRDKNGKKTAQQEFDDRARQGLFARLIGWMDGIATILAETPARAG